MKTWKTGTDPGYEAKTARGLQLYAIAEGTATPGPRDPTVVFGVPWSSASMSSGR